MRRAVTVLLPVLLVSALPASAQRLPGDARPERYDLSFTVDLPGAKFEGTEVIRVRVGAPTPRIVLHALDLTFQEATIGEGAAAQKAAVTLNPEAQTATLTVPRPIPAGATAVHVRYTGILNDQLRG